LADLPEQARYDALVELNVIEQVVNVAQSTVLQDAWGVGQRVTVHGWVYGVHDGLLQDLHISVANSEQLEPHYRAALARVGAAFRSPLNL
ncbi:MAG TPA: carbonic anhydrase, partial [Rhodoferax sp.]